MAFSVLSQDSGSAARAGVVETPHGAFRTPAFMPVGTRGAVKAMMHRDLLEADAEILLCNTYHLALRPGVELIRKMGGLHRFIGWGKPILTDSGGFQVFSLAELRTITDEGVEFRSHIDGERMFLSPERAAEIQNAFGSDIAMAFDECPPYPSEREMVRASMERTIAWEARTLAAHDGGAGRMMFGIVQGGTYRDLRIECAGRLGELGFDGFAIGGVSVGEGPALMREVVSSTVPALPADRPRYLMGVGSPADIVRAVGAGVDMFDCVMPTRNGRNACAFTAHGKLRLRNSEWASSDAPISEDCGCYACRTFSRGYLRHLFNVDEMLGPMLVSLHNVYFYLALMRELRAAVEKNEFSAFSERFLESYKE